MGVVKHTKSGSMSAKLVVNEDHGSNEDKKILKSSMPLTAFNVTNSMLGSGIVVMPFTIMESGFGLGIILLVVVAAVTDYSLCLLIHAGNLSHKVTYNEVARAAFGRVGQGLVLTLAFLYPLIVMTAYHMIIADNASKLLIRITHVEDIEDLHSHVWGKRALVTLFFILVAVMPLSLYRNIAKLAKWSSIALVSVFLIMVFMAIKLVELDLPDSLGAYVFAKLDAVQAVGLTSSAFFCHHSSFIMFNSMKHPTERRWDEVVHISIFVSLATMLAVAVVGYATFTENVQGNILENYCSLDDLMNVSRFLFLITLILTFPVELFVARNVIESVFWPETSTMEAPLWRHILISAAIIAATYGLSLATSCLGIVLEISGLMLALPLAFMLPPLMVIKLEKHPVCHYRNLPAMFLLVVAVTVFTAGWYETIREMIEEGISCLEGREPAFCLSQLNQTANGTVI